MRHATVAFGLVAVAALSPSANAGNGLGKAKDQLAREFKGKQLRLRVDVLQSTPGDARVATTASPTVVDYPNAGQPLQFPALSLVEVDSFWGWKDGLRVSIKSPGYKPRLFSSGLAASLSGNAVTEANQQAAKDAEMRSQMGYVNLRTDDPGEARAAFARLFLIDGAQPTDEEIERCRAAGRESESPDLTASRCGTTVERLRAIGSGSSQE